jgi:hypothetical protein
MAESAMYFSVKSIGLSQINGRKACTLLNAARHNLREIQAEQGANGHIDPTRMHRNMILAGPSTAADVVALSASLAADAGVDLSELRKDYCQAIELVFSLSTEASINAQEYFAQCLQWAQKAYALPVLLATVHNDEAEKHIHVLLLPVKDGAHTGSKSLTYSVTKAMRESFFEQVAGPAGLKRDKAKMRGVIKQWASEAVLRKCEAMGLPAANGPLWPVWQAAIERDPTVAMAVLNIDLNSIRPSEEKPTEPAPANPIGFQDAISNPIGFGFDVAKMQTLSCVGFTRTKASQDRPHMAREGVPSQLERSARQRPLQSPAPIEPACDDGLVRVRDTDFDPTAWAE